MEWDTVKVVALLVALVFGIVLAPSCCTVSQSQAESTLRSYSFKDVEMGGYAWFSCGDDYTFASHFRATNSGGERVDGVICCGWAFKLCTVKF